MGFPFLMKGSESMKFTFNSYKQLDTPEVYLSYPNKKIICKLNALHLKTELRISGISNATFNIYKYNGIQENIGYNKIDIGMYIFIKPIGWFRVTKIDRKDDGGNPYLEVTCHDLSIELSQTYLTSFGSMGTEGDEQGGLDRYALYDASDKAHSIAHIFMGKNPGWEFKYIDPEISKNHRSFNNDSVTSYGFLTGDVATAFECIFTFDSNDRSVSVYKVENLGKKVPFVLTFRNLMKEIDLSWNEDDIKTVLRVSGGNDATGTALSIAGVNPGGNDSISNFSYFYKDMSTELKAKLEEYYQLMEYNSGLITTALSQLKALQGELTTLNSHEPSSPTSTTWSEYGLTQLKSKAAEYKENKSAASDGNMTDPVVKQQYDNYSNLYDAVNAEIVVRQAQITAKEAQVTAKKTEASSYVVSIYDVLGEDLYKELQPFYREDTLCDDSFIATDAMSDNEILEMKQALYEHGVNELSRVCFPQFDMTVDSVNFPVLFKYKGWTEQLELGDIIRIKYSDTAFIEARLLKMEFDWDDFKKFKITFSSKTSLEDGFFELAEIKNMANRSGTTLDYNKSGWNGASQQATTAYSATMKEFMDLSTQQIQSNATNQEVIIDSTGILLRKYLPDENKFAPEKLWITNRQILMFEEPDGTNLKDPKVAIGKVYVDKNGVVTSYYGIAAEYCYGKLIFGESLTIQNKNNTMTVDENGLVLNATNGFRIQMNPDDPANILNISKNGAKLFYIDANTGKLVFKGRAEIDEGYIANWNITTNRLYSGGVGMSSDTAAGAIAYWAGNAISTSAPFWVNNQGKLHTSNIEVTGGTLSVGSKFNVSNDGTLTAVNGNFSGAITGGTINIGNAFVVTRNGEVYLNSGEINLGGIVLTDNYADLGAFRISSQEFGALYTTNGEVVLSTSAYFDGGPALELKKNGKKTRIGWGGIATGDIELTELSDEYGYQWGSVARNIIELWKRV